MYKKAFEIQFNWIFVLIAGAAILLFFTSIIVKQKDVSTASIKSTVLKSIEAIITGVSVSKDTTNLVDIPNSNIEISCGRVSLEEVSKQYQNLILFAPSLIKGSFLITQTLDFSMPYKVTNLLYITSPNVRYIIIGDDSLAKEINKSLPVELKKEFYPTMPQIKSSSNYKVRFVFFGSIAPPPKAFEKLLDSDVTAIKVNGDIDKGTIEFYQRDKNAWLSKGNSVYLGKQSLIGAVYADILELYECNMQNTFVRFNLITKIYVEKIKKLKQFVETSREDQCKEIYENSFALINNILTASSNFNRENVNIISSSSKLLDNENKNLQVYSCTLIY